MPSLDDVLEDLELLAVRRKFRAIDFYEPYPRQKEFHNLGATKRERLLRAGNQIGKTFAGAAETAYHMTGEYPPWWDGHRFNHPVNAWVAGEGATLTRDGPQRLLCGKPGVDAEFGTGAIPRDRFVDTPSKSRGVTDAYDTIQVQHRTDGVVDGISTLSFKSYDQGRAKFQTATLDFWWADEEPPFDIYSELMARIQAVPDGFGFITFTPLSGMSEVVSKFLNEESEDRSDTVMTLWDVPGMTQKRVDQILAGYPAHQRDARTMGVPMQGMGRVFDIPDAIITENPIPFEHVPREWTKLWSIDFGINHPFGATLMAWDKDADVIHVLYAIRMTDSMSIQHSAAMLAVAANIPVAWPQDGTQRQDDGKPIAEHYKKNGLKMLPEHGTWPDGSVSTEAGILEMHERMTTNRFKVSRTLMNTEWGDEFRNYHRDEEGKLVKKKDDLLSATRVGVMMKRKGIPGAFSTGTLGTRKSEETRPFADGVDKDMWGEL